jgi:hypothetical protein
MIGLKRITTDPAVMDGNTEIMTWANGTGHVVFTHDLGFGALLAATDAQGPRAPRTPRTN